MRLLLVNALYPPHQVGGAERSVALLARALARDGVEVHVATLDRRPGEANAVEDGVTVHRLPIDQHYWPWGGETHCVLDRARWHWREPRNARAAQRFGRLLDEVRPDLVHGHVLTGFGAAIWPEVKRRGLPLAHTLRDYALICARAALFRRGTPCARRCLDCRLLTAPTRVASRLVDAVAGNSEFTLAAHRAAGRFDGVGGRRLFNIVPGPSADGAREARTGPLIFGFLGRIEPEKGVGILFDAAARIGRDDWRLRIGGTGRAELLAGYRARCRDERVEWLGQVEAGDFYRSIDVLIVPSLWPEPLPRTLVEGAAHGCSVIAAASGGIPELGGVARRSLLYRADDPDALAAAMRAAIDEPAEWRASSADPASLAPFGEAAVVAAHHDFYEEARRAARRREAP
ncbi:MAG: glycosyltransferase family 4 protein [Sphingomicrobium sp.]